jgi:hypothetical protein
MVDQEEGTKCQNPVGGKRDSERPSEESALRMRARRLRAAEISERSNE